MEPSTATQSSSRVCIVELGASDDGLHAAIARASHKAGPAALPPVILHPHIAVSECGSSIASRRRLADEVKAELGRIPIHARITIADGDGVRRSMKICHRVGTP